MFEQLSVGTHKLTLVLAGVAVLATVVAYGYQRLMVFIKEEFF